MGTPLNMFQSPPSFVSALGYAPPNESRQAFHSVFTTQCDPQTAMIKWSEGEMEVRRGDKESSGTAEEEEFVSLVWFSKLSLYYWHVVGVAGENMGAVESRML